MYKFGHFCIYLLAIGMKPEKSHVILDFSLIRSTVLKHILFIKCNKTVKSMLRDQKLELRLFSFLQKLKREW